jgi:adhesin transport system outer membrane protein
VAPAVWAADSAEVSKPAASPQQIAAQNQLSSLQAASDAAHAAVEAANAAAVAATAAANAASAAANAASEAVKATAQSIQQLPSPQLILDPTPIKIPESTASNTATVTAKPVLDTTMPAEQAKKQLAPIGLQPLDTSLPTQSDSEYEVKDLSLAKLFGVSLIPVAVTSQVHNEYLTSSENATDAPPAGVVKAIDLPGATNAAVAFSRDVHVADERLSQADEQSSQARALLLPNLSVRYARGREISSPSSVIDPLTGAAAIESAHIRSDKSITLRQPILDLPSTYDWERRKEVVTSREETLRGSQADAWLSTVTAYLSLTSSRLIADLSLGYEKQLNQLYDYVDKRANAGASSGSDRQRVLARTLQARATRSQQESAHAAASVEFLRLTNIAPEQIRLPDRDDMGVIPNTVGEAIKIAMENSPDIGSLRSQLKAAELDQNVARAKFGPRFDIEISKLSTNNAGGPTGDQDDTRAMVVMNWNLLNGSGDYYLTREKKSHIDEVKYSLDDIQRRITQSMISEYATLDATREQLVSGYRELNAISSAVSSMSEKMFAGNQSLLDLLDVYDRQYQARTHLVTLHSQEIDALSQISRLLGQATAVNSSGLEVMPTTPSLPNALQPNERKGDGNPSYSAPVVNSADSDEAAVTPLAPLEVPIPVSVIRQ